MQQAARVFTVVCLAGAVATGVFAAPPIVPPRPYAIESHAQKPTVGWLVPDAIEEFSIRMEPATVAANPKAFTLELPGYPPMEAVRTRFVEYRKDWKTWSGTLRYPGSTGRGSGYVHLAYHGDQVTGMIEFEGERYRLVEGRLVRLSDELGTPTCGLDAREPEEMPSLVTMEASESESMGKVTAALATTRVDVLAVYPRAFFSETAATESALFTFIQDSISLANDVFANSQVDAYYNLVNVVPIMGTQPNATGLDDALGWLTGNPTEVVNLRNAYGADLVTIFIPWSWNANNYCGIANLPQNNGTFLTTGGTNPSPMGDRAYTANRMSCGIGDYTLGHEIGHTYGMYHGDQPVSPLAIHPYGRGHTFLVNGVMKATVMACVCPPGGCFVGSGSTCNRVPHFSDPNILYQGVPTGTHAAGSDPGRKNALVARLETVNYAGFQNQSANTPPNASFTVSCPNRTCTFTSTSTDNAGISSYSWDFGDGTTGTGSTVNKTYSTGTSFRVHLVATDTGGQTDVAWNTATPPPVYEGYLEQANCRAISGWAYDQANPNLSINVDIYKDSTKVTTIPANVFRQDLLNAGKGNGVHGFGYTPTSTWKDGAWHQAGVRYPGTATNIVWSPQSIVCGARMFPTQTPAENQDQAGVVYTAGTQFKSTHAGYITHLRFYRGAGETGTNVGRLWTDGGSQLASATFPSSPSSGWVEVALSTPVAISANTYYRVSVNTNSRQVKTGCGIGGGIFTDPLTAQSGYWATGDTFPNNGSCSNFFVDVRFDI
ncbi:MAG TPA: DUF4082 domain-containing protein [Thermoanaerobaculia bacterium]|nr:DUF4082 domain-containing protein [Thermoanaerobaculia bacterium]